MNPAEVAVVLDRLGVAYRQEVPPEALEVWATHLAPIDPSVAADACEGIIATDAFFPTVARFRDEVGAVHRQRAVDAQQAALRGDYGPDPDCGTCGGRKWYEVEPVKRFHAGTGELQTTYEMWKPCQPCAPIEYARWVGWKNEERLVRGRRRPDGLLDYNPTEVLREARDRLDPQRASL